MHQAILSHQSLPRLGGEINNFYRTLLKIYPPGRSGVANCVFLPPCPIVIVSIPRKFDHKSDLQIQPPLYTETYYTNVRRLIEED